MSTPAEISPRKFEVAPGIAIGMRELWDGAKKTMTKVLGLSKDFVEAVLKKPLNIFFPAGVVAGILLCVQLQGTNPAFAEESYNGIALMETTAGLPGPGPTVPTTGPRVQPVQNRLAQ